MNLTVLLVDDEEAVTESLRLTLRKWPFTLFTAKSAAEALHVLAARTVDVVVSDERMPGLQGSHLMGGIKMRYPKAGRIILTGQASIEAAMFAINQGQVHRYLTKPTRAEDLAVAIQEAAELARATPVAAPHASLDESLEAEHPGITSVERTADGYIVLEE